MPILPTVPGTVSRNYSDQPVATHLDYSPTTHPRQLNASADAQRIIDGIVNPKGNGGIPERVAFDGGFRVGKDKHYHSKDVVDALRDTAQHYVNLSQREAAAGNIPLSQQYRQFGADIGRAQVTYAATVKAYWNGSQTTPADMVSPKGVGGDRPIGSDGKALPAPKKAVGE